MFGLRPETSTHEEHKGKSEKHREHSHPEVGDKRGVGEESVLLSLEIEEKSTQSEGEMDSERVEEETERASEEERMREEQLVNLVVRGELVSGESETQPTAAAPTILLAHCLINILHLLVDL